MPVIGSPTPVLLAYQDREYTAADVEAAILLWMLYLGNARPVNEPAYVTRRAAEQFAVDARQMLDGQIRLGAWQQRLASEAVDLHLAGLHRGAGEVHDRTQELLKRPVVQEAIAFSMRRLDRFAAQIAAATAGDVEMISRRAGYYAEAATPTYWIGARELASAEGMTEERRILAAAEHCTTCVDQADLGWQPLGTLNEIGDSECRWRCQCRFQFR